MFWLICFVFILIIKSQLLTGNCHATFWRNKGTNSDVRTYGQIWDIRTDMGHKDRHLLMKKVFISKKVLFVNGIFWKFFKTFLGTCLDHMPSFIKIGGPVFEKKLHKIHRDIHLLLDRLASNLFDLLRFDSVALECWEYSFISSNFFCFWSSGKLLWYSRWFSSLCWVCSNVSSFLKF